VGGRWRAPEANTIDLGTLPARSAAFDLLALAERSEADAGDLITAATLADSATVWPALLGLARAPSVALETRRQAVFWLGQAAGEAATQGLDSIAVDTSSDLEVRKQAVFALSQRPAEEGVPALIRIARTNRHAELRKTALFWLGQSEDPRALALFEEILR
jgi:HEAT repeat protein